MGSDRARISYDPAQQYRAVIAQQGRVTLEADWNEAQQIASEELREETLNFVGSSGTPDNGYEIIDASSFDFTVRKGTMYMGGVRAFTNNDIQYSKQGDWLDWVGDPDWVDLDHGTEKPPARELIYLLLREQEVSAVEDSALLEKALGGPDTTQRLRLIQHIVRLQTKGENCSSALDEAIGIWREKKGLQFNRSTLRLSSAATLQVSFASAPTPVDLCEPGARSGYLGADNQLIRVQIIDFDPKTNRGKLVWGYDNASFLYQAEYVGDQKLKLKTRPVDESHRPSSGQAVEVLRSAAQLPNKPDNEHTAYIAAATGLVTTLTANYDPDTCVVSLDMGLDTVRGSDTVSLDTFLPGEYKDPQKTPSLFLRVWERIEDFTPEEPVSLGGTGLQVTLHTDDDKLWHIGDYWQIAVRPGEPTEVYPHRYLEDAQPPDGPRSWACPLAVISWNTDGHLKPVEDCRNHFDNLVNLTQRNLGGCCTVTLRPEDLTPSKTLQNWLDRFANRNRPNRDQVTICLMPGIYRLPETLKLGPEHSNFTIQGCGDGAELQAESGREEHFLHGLIILNRANYVTFHNLRFQLPIVPFVRAGGKLTPYEIERQHQFDSKFQETLRVSIGIRPLHCALLTVQNCLFRFEMQKTINLFAAGIFAGSECWGLHLSSNRFLQDEEYLLVQEKTRENERRFLIGYLLSPSLVSVPPEGETKIVPSLLEDAVIRDNRFAGLTTAMCILADTGAIRVETNTVLQSISGFWFKPLELGELGKNVGANELNIAAVSLGFLFPLPNSFDIRQLAQKIEGDGLNTLGFDRLSLSLHASGNDIDTRVGNESPPLSGPSLVVAGNRRTSSVILSANKFQNYSEKKGDNFLGTVRIVDVEHCTITGNLVLNRNINRKIEFYSLEIHPSSGEGLTVAVAVTGNCFRGEPLLPPRSDLDTPVPAPMNTWRFLNTVIP